MPSARNYTETHDDHDSRSVGSEQEMDSRKYLEYVQYKKKGGGTTMLFPSNNARRFVVNAVSGFRYDGVFALSNDAKRFFRVVDATSPLQNRVDENGARHSYHPRDSNTFYYDSPEDYVKSAKKRGIRPSISKSAMFEWHRKNREDFGGDDFLFVGGDDMDGFAETADTVIR